ncbi:MAG: zinc ABC transporter substrate-binding protein [Nitrospirae bacterium]|nr:zinc ABC transporter substrate-binding protein [Candidatus Manganitrophaceae bacterium]
MPLASRDNRDKWMRLTVLFFLLIGLLCFSAALYAEDKIPIVVTLPVLKDFAEQVGGSHVEVKSLITGLESEHTYTPKPSDILAVKRAGLLIKIGLGLEVWVNALIKNADRPDLKVVTTSDGVGLIRDHREREEPNFFENDPIDRQHAFKEQHTMGNPHIWLDPENAKIMVRHITEGLIGIDPSHKSDYMANQSRYIMELESLEAEMKQRVARLPNRNIVTHHPAWPYFARRFGFVIKGDILTQVGAEPSAKHIGDLIKLVQQEKVKVIVSEPQLNPKVPQTLAEETGAKVVVLSPLPGAIPKTDTYLDLIRYNTETLVGALGGS